MHEICGRQRKSPRAVAASLNEDPVPFRVGLGKPRYQNVDPEPGETGRCCQVSHDAFLGFNMHSDCSKKVPLSPT